MWVCQHYLKILPLLVIMASALLIQFQSESVDAGRGDSAYSVEGTTLLIHGNIDSKDQLDLDSQSWVQIREVLIDDGVVRIADGSLSKCVNVNSVTAPYGPFKDSVPGLFGTQGYPSCNITLVDGSYKHLILCTEEIGSGYAGDNTIRSVQIYSGCRSLPAGIFKDCSGLTTVHLDCPNLKDVPQSAFQNCTSLKEVKILGSVETLGLYAFFKCIDLIDVCLPDSLYSIGSACFGGDSSLQNVYTASSIRTAGVELPGHIQLNSSSFEGCSSIETATYGKVGSNNVHHVFKDCTSLRTVTIQNGIDYLGIDFFNGCRSLEEVKFPNTMKMVRERAFKDCVSLKNIDFNGCQLNHVLSGAFENCVSLQTPVVCNDRLAFAPYVDSGIYYVPDGVSTIGTRAYAVCTNMVELHLTDSLAEIEYEAFSNCTELRKLYNVPNNLKIWSGVFEDTSISETLIFHDTLYYVPDIYSEYTITSDIRYISSAAFSRNEKLESVIFEGNMANLTLGANIFSGCTNLKYVKLPEDLTYIYNGMFSGCKSLKSFDLTGITYLYGGCFSGSGLESIIIPESVNTVEKNAFANCTSLTRAVFMNPDTLLRYIPSSSNSFSDAGSIFRGCSSLTEVILPGNLEVIPETMFKDCSSLEFIDLPDKLKKIGYGAFSGAGLRSVHIPEGVHEIEANAFRDCKSLERVVLPSTLVAEMSQSRIAAGMLAFMNIGQESANGADVIIRGCPDFTGNISEEIFQGAKINNLVIESAPNFKKNTFKSSTIENIVVSGGSTFTISPDMEVLGQRINQDGRMLVKLQKDGGLVDGYVICSLQNSDVLSISRDDVAISVSIFKDSAFTSISVAEGNPYFRFIDNVLYFNLENGSVDTLAGAKLVHVQKDKIEDLSCFVVSQGVKEIGAYAFSSNSEYIETVILPDSVESVDVRSMQYVRNIAIDSLSDTPVFMMESTIGSKLFFDSRVPAAVVDGLETTLSPNKNVLEKFGGYFAYSGDSILLVEMPKDSAEISVRQDAAGSQLSVRLKDAFNRSEQKLMDGSETLNPGIDGTYRIPEFSGSKVLSFKGITVNQYALDASTDDGVRVSYSILNLDKIPHGTQVKIGLVLDEGYVAESGLSVKANGVDVPVIREGHGFVCTFDVITDTLVEVRGSVPGAMHTVTFLSEEGGEPYQSVDVVSGHKIQFPGIPVREGHVFGGWYVGDELFDFSKSVHSSITAVGRWISGPEYYAVVAEADHGAVTITDLNRNMSIDSGDAVAAGTSVRVSYKPTIGFEARKWIVNDVETASIGKERVFLVDGALDISISSEYTLSSYPYLETDIKTPTSADECKLVWKAIGTEGYNGMVYTPSILGDYVYSWSGSDIFKIDLLTGDIVKRVNTGVKTNSLYYNLVTVGNGYVLAGFAAQVYDADLNPVFRLCLEEGVPSRELKTYYNDGFFYVFTEEKAYKFSAEDSDPSSNNDQLPVVSGDAPYTHYISSYQGQSNLIFTDRFILGIEYGGDHNEHRYLVTYDIDTLRCIDSFRFDEIESANLNTGYISYYNGTAYFNTYSPNSNMFSTAVGSWNSVASIDIDDRGLFDPVTVRYYSFGTTSYPSSLIVVGDYGYLNTGVYFRVIDMQTMKAVRTAPSTMSHGNMAVSVQGDKVYAYLIPYGHSGSIYLYEHDQRTDVLSVIHLQDIVDVKEYSSQIVHFGPHGEILYYNDSGYLFCIAPSYEVSFVTSGESVGSLRFYASEGLDLPVAKWDGHGFLGWYDNSSFEGDPLASIPKGAYGDVTLYAKFDDLPAREFTVTFKTGWGSESFQVQEGAQIALPDEPVYKYNSKVRFRGWDGHMPGMTVSGDVTFEALWYGDVDGDGTVDLRDLSSLKGDLQNSTQTEADDVDGNGIVDLRDLSSLKALLMEAMS